MGPVAQAHTPEATNAEPAGEPATPTLADGVSAASLLALQRTAGNRAVTSMLGRAAPRRSVARTTFQDCSPAQLTSIEAALKQALADLDTAITALSAKPLGPVAQDALWLAFRGVPSDADAVKQKLTAIKTGLGSATIECEDPSSFGYSLVCGDEGVGYGSPIIGTGNLHLCMGSWGGLKFTTQVRAIVHEASHRFNSISGVGEAYFDPDCGESEDTSKASRTHRLDNADSYACFTHHVAHGTPSDLATLAAKYAGGGLTLVQAKGTSTIDLRSDDVKKPRFFLFGAPPASGFKYRWIIVDSSDRRYLMTAPDGASVFEYSDEYAAIVPKKTRELLRERGISSAEVHCRVLIPEIGDRLFTLPVTFSG